MIIYEGPSVLDGKPIVVIATNNTKNRKTGDLIQVWIMRSDIEPHQAVKTGDDESICGNCPHRHFLGGICYVLPFQAPLSIYRAYKRGSYRKATPADFAGQKVRLGAYGDPAAVPVTVWHKFVFGAAGVVGYTHQAKHPNFEGYILQYAMISADTPKQAERYRAAGHPTYRVLKPGEELAEGETMCPSESGVSCADCMGCDAASGSFAIPAHGPRADRKFNVTLTN